MPKEPLVSPFDWRNASGMSSSAALFAPLVTVSKSATLATDVNNNTFVNPGDTLMYSVTVSNIGPDPALNVVFTDQLNADLTLVGTATASPIAVNDSYTSIGNVGITVNMANGLLVNDVNPQGTGTITASAGTATTQGGIIAVSGDGSFTYNPPVGFEGTDSFTYTLTHSNGKMDTGTVSLTVSGMIWFINNNAGACSVNCNGRLSNPFTTLAAFNTANGMAGGVNPDNDDNIFVYESASAYSGGVILRAGQKLIGQDATATLAAISGVTVPSFSNALPMMNLGGGTSVIQNGGGNAITLNQNNTIRGLTVSGTSGAGMIGTSIANLTVGTDVATTGVSGNDLDLSGAATGTVSFGATVVNTAGRSISVQNRSGGTVGITGPISDTGTGILLNNNTGATLNITGGISLNTGANAAFTATGGGTVNVTQNNTTIVNTLTTTAGTALNVANTTIGASGMTFRSINVDGNDSAPTNGIVLNATGTSGGLTVTGSGSANSGGTIQDASDNGISLTSTELVSLSQMNITSNLGNGISGSGVNGFVLANCSITNNGDSAADDDCGIDITNLAGSASGGARPTSITNCTISNNHEFQIQLANTSGTLTNLQMSGNTISSNGLSGTIGNLFNFVSLGGSSSNMELNLTSGTFTGAAPNTATGLYCDNSGASGLVRCNVSGATFTNNNVAVTVSQAQGGNLKFNVSNTTSTGNRSHGLNLFVGAIGTGTVDGNFTGNIVGTNGVAGSASEIGFGIRVQNEGVPTGRPVNVTINNNTVQEVGLPAMGPNPPTGFAAINVNQGIVGQTTSSPTNVTITNNLIRNVYNSRAIIVQQNNSSNMVGSAGTTCANITGNEMNGIAGNIGDGTKIRLRQLTGGVFNVPQADVNAIAAANSPPNGIATTTTTAAQVSVGGTLTFSSPACMQPAPLAPPVEDDPLATPQQSNSGNVSPTLIGRLRQWFSPIFAAFTAPVSYVRLDRAFEKATEALVPTVAAAEFAVPPAGGSEAVVKPIPPVSGTTNRPAKTMIVNSRGETRIVPTAALSTLMAGELITVNGTGSGFTLPAGESTTVMFNATIGAGFTGTAITNQASVSGTGFGPILSNNLSTPVIQAPNFSKAFSPTTIATNTGVSALTFQLVNPNPSQVLTSVAFTDALPAGVEVANPPTISTPGCGSPTFAPTAGATTLTFSGGSIGAGGTCGVSVNVRATTEGAKLNTSSAATSMQANPSGTASATLNVINAPTFSKAFGASSVPLNGTAALSFFITNSSALFPLNGIGFTDTLPAGLVVNTPNGLTTTCNGTATATAEGNTISLSGATLAAGVGMQCSLTVIVRGTTAGAKPNSATLTTTELGANSAATNTVTLNVFAPPTISKAFGVASIPLYTGGADTSFRTSLTFTITNPAGNPGGLTGVGFSDTLPAGLEIANGPFTASNSCGVSPVPTMSGSVGGNLFMFSGGQVVVGAPCTVTLNVRGTTAGTKNNVSGNVTSTEGGTNNGAGGTASASIDVFAPPTVTKAFSPASIPVNGTSTLTITITNPSGNPGALTGIGIVDNFPAGLEVHTTPGAMNSCGGTYAPASGNTGITLSGGSIATAGSSCSISVTVRGTTSGSKLNTTNAVTSTNGGTGGTASATLTVATPPTVMKTFAPSQIPLNGTSTLTLNFTNPNGTLPLTGLSISDAFPAGLEVAATPAAMNTCGGTFSPAAAATSISLSGGSLTAGGNCSISVAVTGTTVGVKTNLTGNVSTTESGAGSTATANITVVAPPAFTKAFSPTNIPVNTNSTLNFTITNNNATVGLSGISFTDVLPTGTSVVDATTNNVCGAGSVLTVVAATRTITLTGGNLAMANPMPTNCTIPVTVTGTTVGAQVNTTDPITSTEGGTGSTATATLNVYAAPTVTKAFMPTGVSIGGVSTLTITITNPAANPGGMTGIAISDMFPAGVEVHTTPAAMSTCGGTFTPVAMATSISLTGGAIPTAGGSCSISVAVRGTTAGIKMNTTGAVSSTEGGTGGTASATLSVAAAPMVTKLFSPSSIPVNGTSTLTLNFTNPNAFALTNLSISDSFPAGLEVAPVPAAMNTCGGTFSPVAAATSISLSGGGLTAAGSCSVSVAVRGTTAGAKNNVTGNVSSAESGAGGTANAMINVFAPPTVSKVFVPTGVALNGQSTLSIVITNPAANPGGLTGIAISDTFPAGLEVSSPLVSSNSCGGTYVPVAGATSISLTGGAIATPGTNCTISVNVRGTTAGDKVNTTGAISSTEGGTGLTASATLNVVAPPAISKAFSPANVPIGQTSTLTFTITNPAANTVALTGVDFTDAFPNAPNLIVATPTGATLTGCGAATLTDNLGGALAPGDLGIRLTGATVGIGGTCTVTVNVTPQAQGTYNNVSGNVTSTNGGTGNTASATLQSILPPTISKMFGAPTIPLNGSTSLSFTIANPNASLSLSGIAFTDSLPAGLIVSTPNGLTGSCGGGTITATAGSGSVSLSGATLAASSNCTFSVNVTGTTGGVKNNVTGNISATESGSGSTASATVTVVPPPTIAKAFGAATIQLNGSTSLTFTLANPSATVAQTGVAYTDTLPAGLVVATPNGLTGVCGGTVTAVAGSGSISLAGGTIAAGGNCTIAVNVTGTTTGVKNNTTSTITSTQGGTGATSNTATVTVLSAPTIAKAFGVASIAAGSPVTITLTLTNSNALNLTGATFTDMLTNMSTVGGAAGGTCAGAASNVFAADTTGLLTFTGITIPASGSCTVTFGVKGLIAGTLPNTTSGVTTTQTPMAGSPSNTANLTVTCPTIDLLPKPSGLFGGAAYALPVATMGMNYSTTITATPAGGSYNFTVIAAPNVLPTNLTLNPSTGQITGIPNVTGTFVFRVQVTGWGSCTGSRLYSLRVNAGSFGAVRYDFDGDGRSDAARWLAESGEWQVLFSSDNELHHISLIAPTQSSEKQEEYLPAVADFDGDRRVDAAVWRPRDGRWLIKRSSDGELMKEQFGLAGDTPMPADYDGDGRADFAIWRNGTDGWHILRSSDQTEQAIYLGQAGDVPVLGDYDGDGLMDVATFRASDGRWLLRYSASGVMSDELFGRAGDLPLAADYDGDGKDDLAVWRQREGIAYVRRSVDQEVQRLAWGGLRQGEWALTGDYDGDGRAELAVWRAAKAVWDFLLNQEKP